MLEGRWTVAMPESFAKTFSFPARTRPAPAVLTRLCAAARDRSRGERPSNIPDTVGYSMTEEYARLMVYIRKIRRISKAWRSAHCRDDLDTVANTLAAIDAGAPGGMHDQLPGRKGGQRGFGDRHGHQNPVRITSAGDDEDRNPAHRPHQRLVATMTGVEVQEQGDRGRERLCPRIRASTSTDAGKPRTYEIISPEEIGLGQANWCWASIQEGTLLPSAFRSWDTT